MRIFQLFFIIFFKQRKKDFSLKACAKLFQKQLLANDIKVRYLQLYCALKIATKFSFKPLFDFIKCFEKHLKQPIIQNSLKNCVFLFSHPHKNWRRLKLCKCVDRYSTLYVPIIAMGAHLLGPYSARTDELTDLISRCKQQATNLLFKLTKYRMTYGS